MPFLLHVVRVGLMIRSVRPQAPRLPPRDLDPCPRERNDDRGGKVGILRLRERMGSLEGRGDLLRGHNWALLFCLNAAPAEWVAHAVEVGQ